MRKSSLGKVEAALDRFLNGEREGGNEQRPREGAKFTLPKYTPAKITIVGSY